MRRIIGLIAALMIAPPLFGAQERLPFSMESVRIMALGGAMTCLTDEEHTPLYNPASLEYLQDSYLAIFGLGVRLNSDAVKTCEKLASETNLRTSKLERLEPGVVTTLSLYSPTFALTGPVQICYARRRFGFSLIRPWISLDPSYAYSFEERRSKVRVSGIADSALVISYGRRIYRDLSIGLSLKYMTRFEANDEVLNLADRKGIAHIRSGICWDFGLVCDLKRYSLKIGLLSRNVLGSLKGRVLKLDDLDLRPGVKYRVKRRTRIGLLYQPDFKIPYGRLAYYPYRTLITLDLGDGDSLAERIHLGMEVMPFRWLALRCGLNDGLRLGVGIRSAVLKIDYAFISSFRDKLSNEEIGGVHAFSVIFSY